MADAITDALDIDVALLVGARGEFTVRVGEMIVAEKTLDGFPEVDACVTAVRAAIDNSST